MEFHYKNRGFDLKKNFEIEPSLGMGVRPCPNSDFGMHSRDAYPQFADVWVPPGYHIEYLRILEYVFVITPGYLASRG